MRAARSYQTTWDKPFVFQGSSAARHHRCGETRRRLRSRGGFELGAAGAESPKALVEPGPRPGLDLSIPRDGLVPRRLEVLEPGVRLLDLEQLLRFAHRPGEGVVVIVHGPDSRTRTGRCTLARAWPTIGTNEAGSGFGSSPGSRASA